MALPVAEVVLWPALQSEATAPLIDPDKESPGQSTQDTEARVLLLKSQSYGVFVSARRLALLGGTEPQLAPIPDRQLVHKTWLMRSAWTSVTIALKTLNQFSEILCSCIELSKIANSDPVYRISDLSTGQKGG